MNAQLKEKKVDFKKMEKKLKGESQLQTENAQLVAKVETLEKDLAASQRKLAEEVKKYHKEQQSHIDSRKHLQQALSLLVHSRFL